MSSSSLAAPRETGPSAGYVSVDLTNAVLIEEFLAACRFWLLRTNIVSNMASMVTMKPSQKNIGGSS